MQVTKARLRFPRRVGIAFSLARSIQQEINLMDRNVPIRWGFIGCGQATELKMLPAFTELADAEVVAVMSRNGLRARDRKSVVRTSVG